MTLFKYEVQLHVFKGSKDSGHLTLLRFKKSPRFLFQDGLVYWKRKFLCYDSWSAATLKHSSFSIQVGRCIPKFLNPFLTVAYRWPALFCCTCKNVFPLYIWKLSKLKDNYHKLGTQWVKNNSCLMVSQQ